MATLSPTMKLEGDELPPTVTLLTARSGSATTVKEPVEVSLLFSFASLISLSESATALIVCAPTSALVKV